ncbi:unnamed protein product [Ectocarpus sp. 6 AP-2014]
MIRCIIHTRDPTRSGRNPAVRGIQTQDGLSRRQRGPFLQRGDQEMNVLPVLSCPEFRPPVEAAILNGLPCPRCEAVLDAARCARRFRSRIDGHEHAASPQTSAKKRGHPSCAYISFLRPHLRQQWWWLAPLVRDGHPVGCVPLFFFFFLRPSIHWTD